MKLEMGKQYNFKSNPCDNIIENNKGRVRGVLGDNYLMDFEAQTRLLQYVFASEQWVDDNLISEIAPGFVSQSRGLAFSIAAYSGSSWSKGIPLQLSIRELSWWADLQDKGAIPGQLWINRSSNRVVRILPDFKMVVVAGLGAASWGVGNILPYFNDDIENYYDLFDPNLEEFEVEQHNSRSIPEEKKRYDIVNPIHNPDSPVTEAEIKRVWEVTKYMCGG